MKYRVHALTMLKLLAIPATFAPLSCLAGCGTENPPDMTSTGGTAAAGTSPGGSASSAGNAGSAGSSVVSGGTGGVGGNAGASAGGSAGSSGSAGSGGSGSSVEPTFAMLKGVIQTSCYGSVCHDLSEHTLPMKIDDKLYTTLTTHVTKSCGPVVKAGSPQDSALVKLLKGPCGDTDRMPYGKCNQDGDEGCISPDIIAAIEKWISNGAPP
ncbi:MAG: hypothetical protein ABUL60_20335 [Myxococcales bacterium]